MTEQPLAAGHAADRGGQESRAGQAADRAGQESRPGHAAEERPAIVIAGREAAVRDVLSRELSRRYGADYQIVVCGQPAELEPRLRALLAAGRPVALIISGLSADDPDGIEVLAAIRTIDPTALRISAVRWGAWETARPVFDAVTLGKIDHWVTCPETAPDEEFHRSITEFLSEWSNRRGGGFEAVRVIGEQWSARSQELRDTFTRNRVPIGFYDATGVSGR
jgi:CheY-like chemotaxis protein